MTRIEPERMLLQYWSYGETETFVQDDETRQTRVEDVESWSEEIHEIQDEMLEGHSKVIRHAHQEELILVQHINNYIGSSSVDFLHDITHGEEETQDVEMAFEAFLTE